MTGRSSWTQSGSIAFVGSAARLQQCAPAVPVAGLQPAHFALAPRGDRERVLVDLAAQQPQATVVFDPDCLSEAEARRLPGVTLGLLAAAPSPGQELGGAARLDRLVCFDPSASGQTIGGVHIWRALPPPVGDAMFAAVRPLRRAPRAMSLGRSTWHREAMLMPAKHRFDLLQAVHGIHGEQLRELLAAHDVGVYVAPEHGGGFGGQVGLHLAAGQLLLAEQLRPGHGLEADIDYLQVTSPKDVVWLLERLARFPEMYQSVRVRGRMKAEQYRASRLFARLLHDLLADVRAFGRGSAASAR